VPALPLDALIEPLEYRPMHNQPLHERAEGVAGQEERGRSPQQKAGEGAYGTQHRAEQRPGQDQRNGRDEQDDGDGA